MRFGEPELLGVKHVACEIWVSWPNFIAPVFYNADGLNHLIRTEIKG